MNRFRYWLADLISGGDLTYLRKLPRGPISITVHGAGGGGGTCSDPARDALRKIAAQVTPGANATVKRMGRIAEEALK